MWCYQVGATEVVDPTQGAADDELDGTDVNDLMAQLKSAQI